MSRAIAVAHENARLQKAFSEKKMGELKRAKTRRLKKEQLKIEPKSQKLRMLWNWLKLKFNFMRSWKSPLGVLLAEQMGCKT